MIVLTPPLPAMNGSEAQGNLVQTLPGTELDGEPLLLLHVFTLCSINCHLQDNTCVTLVTAVSGHSLSNTIQMLQSYTENAATAALQGSLLTEPGSQLKY